MRTRRTIGIVALAVTVLLQSACGGPTDDGSLASPTGPIVVIPPGVASTRTADQVAKMMLAEIAADEQRLGRALARPRIIRVQLLRPGENYELRNLDGTNPNGSSMSPDGGPGWMVEAVGTFVGRDRRTGVVDSLGLHGFHLWDDAGGEGWGFNPCWLRMPSPDVTLDGQCH